MRGSKRMSFTAVEMRPISSRVFPICLIFRHPSAYLRWILSKLTISLTLLRHYALPQPMSIHWDWAGPKLCRMGRSFGRLRRWLVGDEKVHLHFTAGRRCDPSPQILCSKFPWSRLLLNTLGPMLERPSPSRFCLLRWSHLVGYTLGQSKSFAPSCALQTGQCDR